MGKYLRDIQFVAPNKKRGATTLEIERYKASFASSMPILELLTNLFNYKLPKKYATGVNCMRFVIELAAKFDEDNHIVHLGDVITIRKYFDQNHSTDKFYLIEILIQGISSICSFFGCDEKIFKKIHDDILDEKISLNKLVGTRKLNSDKTYNAQISVKEDVSLKQTYIQFTNCETNQTIKVFVDFIAFTSLDVIKWVDATTVHLFLKRENKNDNADFFEIGLGGRVTYIPQTKFSMFEFALKLLSENKTEDAKFHLENASKLNHGKAKNVLLNLQLGKSNLNPSQLTKQPNKQELEILKANILLNRLENDMFNGGFIQFFCNWGFDNYKNTLKALRNSNRAYEADIIEDCYKCISSFEDDKRITDLWDILKFLTQDMNVRLDELDIKYCSK